MTEKAVMVWESRHLLAAGAGALIYAAGMKTLRLVPLAFLAGVHGFAIFAPYLAIFLAASHVIRKRAG